MFWSGGDLPWGARTMLRNFFRILDRSLFVRQPCLLIGALIVIASAENAAADDIMVTKAPAMRAPSAYDWSAFYAGGHLGYAWAAGIGRRARQGPRTSLAHSVWRNRSTPLTSREASSPDFKPVTTT